MKKIALAALCITLLSTASYAADRIRDFSMPLNDSLSQGNSAPSKTIINNNNNYQQPQEAPQDNGGYAMAPIEAGSNHFMDNYCDPNFKAGGFAHTSISDCILEKRQVACQEYSSLPADARKVMNLAIDCRYAAGEQSGQQSDEGEEPIKVSMPAGCENSAELRINALRRYYNDNYVSHALLFLVDESLEGGAQCIKGSR